ncbi:quinone-dependent dihydroorotate dehydrogenase [Paenibacillus psychroresistens]|uniref:Dihydroorotate dehydrogenase (quinone) n=1 Tax=Paenibacillus psychroresistens TaxID=1778678 RepID=A0A6B8RPJ2_9BACL|nr:quinone-dependent dihydroorotate dehydrogenase [Paenibacillus psychroresistens]QGQ97423.1 quinone-dependent dihydroorotate dehydrogenase [Paenibacillus psychroresistens]
MFYRKLLRPLLFGLSAEKAHHLTIHGLSLAEKIPGGISLLRMLYGMSKQKKLTIKLGGIEFPNPIGLAAGLDKNAVAVAGFSSIGFGFMEVGTITPKEQPGNPLPRLFRLPIDTAIINRMGFNNVGADQMAVNLKKAKPYIIPVAVNIGKNKVTANEDAVDDYRACIRHLYAEGDFFVVNISSPNTPGLRSLQHGEELRILLEAVKEEMSIQRNRHGGSNKPIWVKIAPDVSVEELSYMIETIVQSGITGVIATNTTLNRDGLQHVNATEAGGLSGKPLTNRSTEIIRQIYKQTNGTLPIIGCGGVFTAEDAYDKIRAGASLVEVYTALIYEGPSLIKRLNKGLLQLLARDGYSHISQAIGADHPKLG